MRSEIRKKKTEAVGKAKDKFKETKKAAKDKKKDKIQDAKDKFKEKKKNDFKEPKDDKPKDAAPEKKEVFREKRATKKKASTKKRQKAKDGTEEEQARKTNSKAVVAGLGMYNDAPAYKKSMKITYGNSQKLKPKTGSGREVKGNPFSMKLPSFLKGSKNK